MVDRKGRRRYSVGKFSNGVVERTEGGGEERGKRVDEKHNARETHGSGKRLKSGKIGRARGEEGGGDEEISQYEL